MANPESHGISYKSIVKWEYKVVISGQIHLIEALDEMGKSGWEAYAHHCSKDGAFVSYFKRRV